MLPLPAHLPTLAKSGTKGARARVCVSEGSGEAKKRRKGNPMTKDGRSLFIFAQAPIARAADRQKEGGRARCTVKLWLHYPHGERRRRPAGGKLSSGFLFRGHLGIMFMLLPLLRF